MQCSVKKCRRQSAAKVLPPIPLCLEEFYQTEKLFDAAHKKNDVTRSQFDGTISSFIPLPRNILISHFVYTGAAAYRAVRGKTEKEPRGGSRGVMTRSLSGR
jgi:hypothetical protein